MKAMVLLAVPAAFLAVPGCSADSPSQAPESVEQSRLELPGDAGGPDCALVPYDRTAYVNTSNPRWVGATLSSNDGNYDHSPDCPHEFVAEFTFPEGVNKPVVTSARPREWIGTEADCGNTWVLYAVWSKATPQSSFQTEYGRLINGMWNSWTRTCFFPIGSIPSSGVAVRIAAQAQLMGAWLPVSAYVGP